MTHPLTAKMCELASLRSWRDPDFDVKGTVKDMQCAYEKGVDDAIEGVRTAGLAHWSALYEVKENLYKQQQEDN